MKLCLHKRGVQPRRKNVKKKHPPAPLTFRQRIALEKARKSRSSIGPQFVLGGVSGARAAMTSLLDDEIELKLLGVWAMLWR